MACFWSDKERQVKVRISNFTIVALTYNQVSIACSSVSPESSTCVAPFDMQDSREPLAIPRHAGALPQSYRQPDDLPRSEVHSIAHS